MCSSDQTKAVWTIKTAKTHTKNGPAKFKADLSIRAVTIKRKLCAGKTIPETVQISRHESKRLRNRQVRALVNA